MHTIEKQQTSALVSSRVRFLIVFLTITIVAEHLPASETLILAINTHLVVTMKKH